MKPVNELIVPYPIIDTIENEIKVLVLKSTSNEVRRVISDVGILIDKEILKEKWYG